MDSSEHTISRNKLKRTDILAHLPFLMAPPPAVKPPPIGSIDLQKRFKISKGNREDAIQCACCRSQQKYLFTENLKVATHV